MKGYGLNWSAAPFVRLLIPLILGVLAGYKLGFYLFLSNWWIMIFLSFPLFINRVNSLRYQRNFGILLILDFFLIGIYIAEREQFPIPTLKNGSYCAILDDYPTEKKNTFQLTGPIKGSDYKILIYVEKGEKPINGSPGDLMVFSGTPELIENDGNPFEFNYRQFLNGKKIGYRIFLKNSRFILLKGEPQFQIYRVALVVRERLIRILRDTGISEEAIPLIASISFGAREEVDKEVIRSFTSTGVIHVLAVSGMNVGLVYMILSFLLQMVSARNGGSLFRTIVFLLGIWGYALITGLPSSILRAALMLTFVIIGKALNRNASIYNSLAVSAFFLIFWYPAIIFDIGFQLSYAAVLAIACLQPMIYRLFDFQNWLLENCWLLLSVTFAAQAGTLPFTLSYFHQFPVYFWLANLFVIPLVSLVLYLSFVVIGSSFVSSYLASLLGKILEWLIQFILWIVNQVSNMPNAVLNNLYPDIFQTGLFLTGLLLIVLFWSHRRPVMLKGSILCFILLIWLSGWEKYQREIRNEMVFFKIKGMRLLVVTQKDAATIIYDPSEYQSEKLTYSLRPYLGARAIKELEVCRLNDTVRYQKGNLSVFGNLCYFRGVKMIFELENTDCSRTWLGSCPEIVWRRLLGRSAPFSELLVGKGIDSGMEMKRTKWLTGNAEYQLFPVNKAIRLSFFNSFDPSKEQIRCHYFNSDPG